MSRRAVLTIARWLAGAALFTASVPAALAQSAECGKAREVPAQALDEATYNQLNLVYEKVGDERYDEAYADLQRMLGRAGRDEYLQAILHQALAQVEASYDYVLMDCPPSLGLLTLNVLTAADGVIIPIQCEYYALEGISQLLNTVRLVQQNFNPALAIDGVLLTMYDSRLNLCRQVAADAKEYFGGKVFRTVIPRNVRLAEAPSFGQPILLYDAQSVGAKSYLSVAQELMRRVEGAGEARATAEAAG